MDDAIITRIRDTFDFATPRESSDWPAVNVPMDKAHAFLKSMRDEFDYDMLVDVTAIDWSEEESPRFTVLWHLFNTRKHAYLRIAADCQNDEQPEMPTASDLWEAANWHERECYDFFGIKFTGHPDLRRILMWDGYPYFPLRKEFPLAGEETELPAPDVAEVTGAKVKAAPMMGGPFHAAPGKPMSEQEPRARDESWTEKSEKPADS